MAWDWDKLKQLSIESCFGLTMEARVAMLQTSSGQSIVGKPMH